VTRARIVLLAAEGVANTRIAREVGVSLPTVPLWRTLRRAWSGWTGGRSASGSAAPVRAGRTRQDRRRDADPAGGAGDTLESVISTRPVQTNDPFLDAFSASTGC
jgi:transposase-like protein